MDCAYCDQPLDAHARICRLCGMLVARVVVAARSPESRDYPLFPVATHKFLVLSVCTLNLYQIYWLYQNWKRIRDGSGQALSPFWRAFFAVLWVIPFARQIKRRADESGIAVPWNPIAVGVAFIAVSLLLRLPDPWWLFALGTSAVMVPVVETCQAINSVAQGDEGANDRYSPANVTTIVCGGLFLVLVVVATLTQA